jgi:multidrug efflux system membrane fusion protein
LKQVIVVPDLAVERGPNGLYAFVVGTGNKVEMRSVTVARDGEGDSVITQGLTPGEHVVVSGQYELQPGTLVKPQETDTPQVAQTAAQAQ